MGNVVIYNGADKDPQRCSAGVYRQLTTFRSEFKQCRAKKLDGCAFCGTHKRANEYEPPKRSSVYSARALLHEVLRDVVLPKELSASIQKELGRKPY